MAKRLLSRRIQLVAWAQNLSATHPRLRADVDYALAKCIQEDGKAALRFRRKILAYAAGPGRAVGGFHSSLHTVATAERHLDEAFMVTSSGSQVRVWILGLLLMDNIPGMVGLTLKGRERLV